MSVLSLLSSAYRTRDAMREIARQVLLSEFPPPRYAEVISVDHATKTAGVRYPGDPNTFVAPYGGLGPFEAGAVVRIAGPNGARYIEDVVSGVVSAQRIRLTNINDASLSSTAHAIQVGADDGPNLVIDNNEILARNNGAGAGLFLNAEGGGVVQVGGQPLMPAGSQISPTVTNETGWSVGVQQARRVGPLLALGIVVTRTGADYPATAQAVVATLSAGAARGTQNHRWPLVPEFTAGISATAAIGIRAGYNPSTGEISVRSYEGTWATGGFVILGGVVLADVT